MLQLDTSAIRWPQHGQEAMVVPVEVLMLFYVKAANISVPARS
jgi:hypothetical protein